MKFPNETNRILRAFSFVPAYIVVLWLIVFACIQLTEPYERYEDAVGVEEPIACVNEQTSETEALGRIDENGKIDINTANSKRLEQLPEIGPVKARKIIETRALMGGFRTVDDLLNVDGIGEKTLEGLRELVVVL
ncbi:MAG: ComEA family DNA-binding protein [Clostridia bacterium]|nr:ComEA family DNA-binding protein [Clostridia bacterium]